MPAIPMLLADVNVYVYAFRYDSPRADEHSAWMQDRLTGLEPFGVSELVLSAFVRIVTSHRVYRRPSSTADALAFCDAILTAPAAVSVRSGARHWRIFTELCQTVGARANVVPDAYLAALAIEHGATWITTDRGFARFPGLRWKTPLDN